MFFPVIQSSICCLNPIFFGRQVTFSVWPADGGNVSSATVPGKLCDEVFFLAFFAGFYWGLVHIGLQIICQWLQNR